MNRSIGQENNGGGTDEHVRALLQDYIDGRLPAERVAYVRAHIAGCADCRADFVELKSTQQLLKSLPTVPPPRTFTLTPEMAASARPEPFWRRLLAPGNTPRLAFGSVFSLVLAALVLFAGLAGSPAPSPMEASTVASGARAASGFANSDTAPSSGVLGAAAEATQTPAAASDMGAQSSVPPAGGAGASGNVPPDSASGTRLPAAPIAPTPAGPVVEAQATPAIGAPAQKAPATVASSSDAGGDGGVSAGTSTSPSTMSAPAAGSVLPQNRAREPQGFAAFALPLGGLLGLLSVFLALMAAASARRTR